MKLVITGATGMVGRLLVQENKTTQFELDTTRRDILSPMEFPACDYIIHAAGRKFGTKSVEDPYPYVLDNVIGTFNVLEAAKKVKPKMFVYLSSTDAENLNTPYGATKAAGEALTLAYHNAYGLNACIWRMPALLVWDTVGEGFVQRLLRGEDVVVNEGSQDWWHGDAGALEILSGLESAEAGSTYSLPSFRLTNKELVEICRAQTISS